MDKTMVRNNKGQFIKGHRHSEAWYKSAQKGHPHTNDAKLKIGKSKEFDNNYNWKGDKVGYSALHKWVYKMLGKATECSSCAKNEGRIEWANISGLYKRDISDWEQLCRKCHMIKDGRLQAIKQYQFV